MTIDELKIALEGSSAKIAALNVDAAGTEEACLAQAEHDAAKAALDAALAEIV